MASRDHVSLFNKQGMRPPFPSFSLAFALPTTNPAHLVTSHPPSHQRLPRSPRPSLLLLLLRLLQFKSSPTFWWNIRVDQVDGQHATGNSVFIPRSLGVPVPDFAERGGGIPSRSRNQEHQPSRPHCRIHRVANIRARDAVVNLPSAHQLPMLDAGCHHNDERGQRCAKTKSAGMRSRSLATKIVFDQAANLPIYRVHCIFCQRMSNSNAM